MMPLRRDFKNISLAETKALSKLPDYVLVDVREDWEFEEFNIGGINIPLADIRQKRELLAPFSSIIVICTNGTRSKVAAMDYCRVPEWQDKIVYHLKGGILEAE
jgi:rhodanese-related sulfurtransferase